MWDLEDKTENDSVWVTCFDSAGLIANVCVASPEYAPTAAKYYRRYYPSVKVFNEREFRKANDADYERKNGFKPYNPEEYNEEECKQYE